MLQLLKAQEELTQNSPWLAAIGPELTNSLMSCAQLSRVKQGANVYALGDDDGCIYGLSEGAVGIQVDDADTGVAIGHVFGQGAWFGEASAITGKPRLIGAHALVECTLLRVSKSNLTRLEATHPQIWRALGVLAVMNTAVGIQIARDLMVLDGKARCLSTLSRIAVTFGQARIIPLTQKQLAEACRLSRSSFAKILAELESEGAVERKYGKLIVKDLSQPDAPQ